MQWPGRLPAAGVFQFKCCQWSANLLAAKGILERCFISFCRVSLGNTQEFQEADWENPLSLDG